MKLNYHHLYYFWQVAKSGHLTRTAEALHVSQSSLSQQIRQLEERLGQALFIREGRQLHLSEAAAAHLLDGFELFPQFLRRCRIRHRPARRGGHGPRQGRGHGRQRLEQGALAPARAI